MSKQSLTLRPSPHEVALPQVLGPGCCAPFSAEALDGTQAVNVAKVFKALGDPVRLRLLSMIASSGSEVCVCDLTPVFNVSGPTISHHLKTLREAGLVDCERRGTWVYYWAKLDRLQWLSSLLATPGLTGAPEPDAGIAGSGTAAMTPA